MAWVQTTYSAGNPATHPYFPDIVAGAEYNKWFGWINGVGHFVSATLNPAPEVLAHPAGTISFPYLGVTESVLLVARTSDGALYRSTDGHVGASWESLPPLPLGSDTRFYAGPGAVLNYTDGSARYSLDNGSTWAVSTNPPTSTNKSQVVSTPGGHVFYRASNARTPTLWHSSDRGASWAELSQAVFSGGSLGSIAALGEVLFVLHHSAEFVPSVWKYESGVWQNITSSFPTVVFSAADSSAFRLHAADNRLYIIRTEENGGEVSQLLVHYMNSNGTFGATQPYEVIPPSYNTAFINATDTEVLISTGTAGVAAMETLDPPPPAVIQGSAGHLSIPSVLGQPRLMGINHQEAEVEDALLLSSETSDDRAEVEDALLLSSETSDERATLAEDRFALGDARAESRVQVVQESVRLLDAILADAGQELDDTVVVSDAQQAAGEQALADVLALTEALNGASAGAGLAVESLRLSDVLKWASGKTDEVEVLVALGDALDDARADQVEVSFQLLDAVDDGAARADAVEDALALADAATAVTASVHELSQVLHLSDSLHHKDRIAVAWVMNTETGAPYWYSNWQFSDMVQVGDKILAVGPEGLVVLGADTDAGETIDAVVQYGFTDFGSEHRKRVPEFVFGYTAETPMAVEVETYGQGYSPYEYQISSQRLSEQPNNGRLTPGKGLNARYWRIAVRNTDGGAFAVDSITATVAESTRRL